MFNKSVIIVLFVALFSEGYLFPKKYGLIFIPHKGLETNIPHVRYLMEQNKVGGISFDEIFESTDQDWLLTTLLIPQKKEKLINIVVFIDSHATPLKQPNKTYIGFLETNDYSEKLELTEFGELFRDILSHTSEIQNKDTKLRLSFIIKTCYSGISILQLETLLLNNPLPNNVKIDILTLGGGTNAIGYGFKKDATPKSTDLYKLQPLSILSYLSDKGLLNDITNIENFNKAWLKPEARQVLPLLGGVNYPYYYFSDDKCEHTSINEQYNWYIQRKTEQGELVFHKLVDGHSNINIKLLVNSLKQLVGEISLENKIIKFLTKPSAYNIVDFIYTDPKTLTALYVTDLLKLSETDLSNFAKEYPSDFLYINKLMYNIFKELKPKLSEKQKFIRKVNIDIAQEFKDFFNNSFRGLLNNKSNKLAIDIVELINFEAEAQLEDSQLLYNMHEGTVENYIKLATDTIVNKLCK